MLPSNVTITEIYRSVQGESSFAGLPCTFVRLTGCPLRCRWCDTVYGFKGGTKMSVDEVMKKVDSLGIGLVELTGGEPLAQSGCVPLAQKLVDSGREVLIETSGSFDITVLPPEVVVIMDIKCPSSGMADKNHWENINHLRAFDEVKFVIGNKEDFEWAKEIVLKHSLEGRCKLLFSPAWGLIKEKDLVSWMLALPFQARLNLQQHKYIWDARKKGV